MSEIEYTTITYALCQQIERLIRTCFPQRPPEDDYTDEEFQNMVEGFPEGTIVALDGGQVVGVGTGIFTDADLTKLPPTEHELLYSDEGSNHTQTGRYYYGSDFAVHPNYRGRGIGRAIYTRRKALVRAYEKKGFFAAAVLPGFANYKGRLSIHDYVEQVVAGELFDPTLSMQLRNGFKVLRLLHEFAQFPASDHWLALIYWENPDLTLQI